MMIANSTGVGGAAQKSLIGELEPLHQGNVPSFREPSERRAFIAPKGNVVHHDVRDTLRRVGVVIFNHITRSERKRRRRHGASMSSDTSSNIDGDAAQVFPSKEDVSSTFNEDRFIKSQWCSNFAPLRSPPVGSLCLFGLQRVQVSAVTLPS